MGISARLSVEGDRGLKEQYEEIVASRVLQQAGTILRVDGTTAVVEFKDAADAVNCAISLQEQFASYNRLGLDEGTILAKVGIHYGEIADHQGEIAGKGLETLALLLARIPEQKIYLTREADVRVRVHIHLPFEQVRGEGASDPNEPEMFSLGWQAVAGNLMASLKRLDEDDLQKTTTLAAKMGIGPPKRAASVIMIFLLLFIFIVFKLLKWL